MLAIHFDFSSYLTYKKFCLNMTKPLPNELPDHQAAEHHLEAFDFLHGRRKESYVLLMERSFSGLIHSLWYLGQDQLPVETKVVVSNQLLVQEMGYVYHTLLKYYFYSAEDYCRL